MTTKGNRGVRDAGHEDLAALVQQLRELQRRIAEVSGGQVDAVLDAEGNPLLLPQAQSELIADAGVQRAIAAERSLVLNALPGCVALLDANGRIAALNGTWRRSGEPGPLPSEYLVEGADYIEACLEALGRDTPEGMEAAEALPGVLSGALEEFHVEYRRSGEAGPRWYRLTVTALVDEQLSGAVAMHVDVSDRRRVEQRLRESEERFRRTFRDAGTGMAICTTEGRFVAANSAYCNMVGYTEEELVDLDITRLTHPEDRAENQRNIEELLRDRRDSFIVEKRYVRKDGAVVWARVSVAGLRGPAGEIVGLVGVMEDVTQRHEAEAALHEANRRLETLMANLPGMVYRCANNRDWEMEFVSGGVAELTGYGRDDLLDGRTVSYGGLIHREDRDRVWHEVQCAVRERRSFETVYRIRDASGAIKWVWEKGRGVYDASGEVTSLEGFISDITEQIQAQERIRQSEALLSVASKISRLGAWAVDVGTMSLTWSREVRAIHEVDDDYVPELEDAIQFCAPEHLETLQTHFTNCLERGEPFDLEVQVVTAKKRRVWVRTIGEAVRDGSGRIVRVQGAFQDISDRMEAEQSLRMSEERFRILSSATNDAVWDWDLVTDRVWWNEGFETIFGYRREEVESTSESWTSRIHPDDYERVVAGIREVIDGDGDTWEGEYRFRRADGTYAHVYDKGRVIRDASGQGIRMVGGMTDESGRKESEARLAEQAALIDQASDAIMVCDLNRRVLFWSRGAEAIYGWRREEAEGRGLTELLYEGEGAEPEALARLFGQGEWQGEAEHQTKAGSMVTVLVRSNLLRDDAGQPKSILMFHSDITERKRLEQQFLRAQRMESVGTLAGGMAHDLNNVLAPILMAVDVLRAYVDDEDGIEILETVKDSALHGSALIKQVLGFARGVEGRRVRVDPALIVTEVERVLHDTFPPGIALKVEVPDDIWPIHADATQIHQILMNLSINARDAMPGGGELTIALENMVVDDVFSEMNVMARPGPYVIIRVEDTGVGMSQQVQERVFEPFFTTKEVGKGTGLGLSTTFSIVRDHGGFIHLYSEPGKGARFKVYLPATTSTEETEEAAIERSHLPRGHGELVLLVDDEQNIRDITRRALERYGYRVITAVNGADAVAQYAERRGEIAVVLTDMSMPVMDGPSLIVALKAIDADVRIIGSSGLGANGYVAKAMGAGVEHFVPKPYTAETVLTILDRVLNPGAGRGGGSERKEPPKTATVSAGSAGEAQGRGTMILIVDDEAAIVRLASRILELAGHTVESAEDPESALRILAERSDQIDVVITDLKMPGQGGAHLAHEIREKYPQVKLIIMSGSANLRSEAQRVGEEVRTILKPFTTETLREVVRDVLDSEASGN